MEEVEEDVKKKTIVLQSLRLNNQLSTNQKTYASVQSFMLKHYSNRIQSFQRASENSIVKVCWEFGTDNRDDRKVADLVNKHIKALVKQRVRLTYYWFVWKIWSDWLVCHDNHF